MNVLNSYELSYHSMARIHSQNSDLCNHHFQSHSDTSVLYVR